MIISVEEFSAMQGQLNRLKDENYDLSARERRLATGTFCDSGVLDTL